MRGPSPHNNWATLLPGAMPARRREGRAQCAWDPRDLVEKRPARTRETHVEHAVRSTRVLRGSILLTLLFVQCWRVWHPSSSWNKRKKGSSLEGSVLNVRGNCSYDTALCLAWVHAPAQVLSGVQEARYIVCVAARP